MTVPAPVDSPTRIAKTAVIIIHGVGEQHPMATVRAFVRFFAGDFFRSKPDDGSDFFEMRRLSTFSSGATDRKALEEARTAFPFYPADTVFYEYYWAFHFRDTRVAMVIRWALGTIRGFGKTRTLNAMRAPVRRILLTWGLILLLLAVAIGFIAWGIADLIRPNEDRLRGVLSIGGGSILPLLLWITKPVFLGWAGDAARYFSASPDTPVERQEIRAKGVALLDRLHKQKDSRDRPEYGRLIVVGHSLGSVIAYDLLSHYWAKVNVSARIAKASAALDAVEHLTHAHDPPTVDPGVSGPPAGTPTAERYRALQTSLRAEIPSTEWRISDLVTLGSPLTYARFLMARDGNDLRARQAQRELPVVPPIRDLHPDIFNNRSFVYTYPPVTGPDHVVPHHAAPFLLTRWTNMYLPHDPIGGPVAPMFGWGILDIELDNDGSASGPAWLTRLLDTLGGAHVRYWEVAPQGPLHPYSRRCAEHLRAIVNNQTPPAVP